jgi:DnaJ-domain-containing protein 1
MLAVAVTAGAFFLLARYGLSWLALVGAAALAILKRLLPFALRFLPAAARLFQQRRARQKPRGHEPGPAQDGDPGSAQARGAPAPRGGMSRAEALEVLGLAPGATPEEVISAHRHLIKKAHPDAPGGSEYFAKKLNQAKDVLLG